MAASVGSARRPFTATWWKPPANHMVRMMALSSTSTTLQQKCGCWGQRLAAHAPSGALPTPAGASTPFLRQGHCSHWRHRAILGRGPGGRSTRAGTRPRPHRPPFLTQGDTLDSDVWAEEEGPRRPQGRHQKGPTHISTLQSQGAVKSSRGQEQQSMCENPMSPAEMPAPQKGWKMERELPRTCQKKPGQNYKTRRKQLLRLKAGTDSQHHVKALTRMHFVKEKKKTTRAVSFQKFPSFQQQRL